MKKLTVGSLFAGIGGFDLGLERSGGFEIAWQIEIDDYCQKVLAKHWPNVARYGDIRACGAGRKYELSPVDVLCGGFPCQPHSIAGKRKASTDERDLWPEYFRLICELRPRYALGENVLGLLSSENGRFFTGILRDLASIGYDAQWCVLRASDFGAPHRRARVFLVAYPGVNRCRDRAYQQEYRQRERTPDTCVHGELQHVAYLHGVGSDTRRPSAGVAFRQANADRTCTSDVAYTHIQRCEERDVATCDGTARLNTRNVSTFRVFRETQSLMGGDAHGLSRRLDGHRWPVGPGQAQHDWEPPRVTMEPQPHRVAQLKALGNAIVPQCATSIAQCILTREAMLEEGVA